MGCVAAVCQPGNSAPHFFPTFPTFVIANLNATLLLERAALTAKFWMWRDAIRVPNPREDMLNSVPEALDIHTKPYLGDMDGQSGRKPDIKLGWWVSFNARLTNYTMV